MDLILFSHYSCFIIKIDEYLIRNKIQNKTKQKNNSHTRERTD